MEISYTYIGRNTKKIFKEHSWYFEFTNYLHLSCCKLIAWIHSIIFLAIANSNTISMTDFSRSFYSLLLSFKRIYSKQITYLNSKIILYTERTKAFQHCEIHVY